MLTWLASNCSKNCLNTCQQLWACRVALLETHHGIGHVSHLHLVNAQQVACLSRYLQRTGRAELCIAGFGT